MKSSVANSINFGGSMLNEVRKAEKELGLAPVDMALFGEDMIARAKAIKWYLLDLVALRERVKAQKAANN